MLLVKHFMPEFDRLPELANSVVCFNSFDVKLVVFKSCTTTEGLKLQWACCRSIRKCFWPKILE